MAHPNVEEAEREDAPDGHLPQVGLGANERDNRQKEEEKVTLGPGPGKSAQYQLLPYSGHSPGCSQPLLP